MKRISILLIALAATFQWCILLERFFAAIWGLYKFWGYGGEGQITVAISSQVIFYLLSVALSFVSYFLWRGFDGDRIFKVLAKYSTAALIGGMIFWTVVLMSPLTAWR